MKTVYLISFCLYSLYAQAQNNDIDFLINKIESDYPGFSEKSNKIVFEGIARKIAHENAKDTFQALALIVDYFSDRHLQVYTPKAFVKVDSSICTKNVQYVTAFFAHNKLKQKYEGYWLNDYNDCVIALIKDTLSNDYIGYVVEERGGHLLRGQVMGKFHKTFKGYFLTDYFSPYSGSRYFVRTFFRNDTVLTTGADSKWIKVQKYTDGLLNRLPNYSFTCSARQIDSKNYLITLPICSRDNAILMDSIVKANYEAITHTENLIVDIRNNLGGTSTAFKPLMPFVYTNPIVWTNRYLYCTKSGVINMRKELNDYISKGHVDSQYITSYRYYIDLQEQNIKKFILYPADTFKYATVMKYPKHVGIIVNYACQSAAELMVLTFKQSKKVTIFGEHTMGAIDYLDYYSLDMPSENSKLYIPTTKRYIPRGGEKYDGKGIDPDIKIDDGTTNWVDFVVRYYEKG